MPVDHAEKAEQFARLSTRFSQELGELQQRWAGAYGSTPSNEEQHQIMLAAYVAICTRTKLIEKLLRTAIPKERLKGVEKDCERAARASLEGEGL